MGRWRLLMLGLLLNLAHGSEMMEDDCSGGPEVEIQRNVTAVLGGDVYLRCEYRGNDSIAGAVWKRQRNSRFQLLAGFSNGVPFSRVSDFSFPASATNLTVKMRASNVEAEGEYICTFKTEDEELTQTMFLKVHVRPQTEVFVTEETDHGTHYQSVQCSAFDGKPAAQISWLIDNKPPGEDYFSIVQRDADHRNGTASVVSLLRFPTHLQDEGRVTCVVDHPTLPGPIITTVAVETFVAPNVSVQAEMRQGEEEEEEYWRVSCVASGGRPETLISLVTTADEEIPQRENGTDAGISSYRLPAQVYEGHNVTCVFNQPKLPGTQFRAIQLPSFYLSGVQLLANSSIEMQPLLELEEGQSDVSIGLEAIGNVPRYAVSCQKEYGSPLPSGVEVVGRALTFQGPVDLLHAGLYECEASYYRHRALVQINITVGPKPVLVPPSIRVDLRYGPSDTEVECSAASAVPAARVSWRLPAGVPAVSSIGSTLHNGSHSVTGVLILGAPCFPQELTVGCVIDHPLFRTPEIRNVTVPLCAPPNITLSSGGEWRGGEEYTVARCRVDSVATAATITWRLGDGDGDVFGVDPPEGVDVRTEVVQGVGMGMALSTVRLPSSLYSGQTLSCVVTGHPGLQGQEQRDLLIPFLAAPVLNVSVGSQEDSALWQAVCDYQAEGVKANLTWVLPAGPQGQVSLRSQNEGRTVKTKLTYQFPLESHEGHDLTCLVEYQRRRSERRTIRIPKYYISSLTVLNHTTPMKRRHSGDQVTLRLSLRDDLPGQRILLQVNGNVPTHSLACRSGGSFVQMDGDALVFQSEVKGRGEGLYTCLASFYHHTATVHLQVEVLSPERQLVNLVSVCVASVSAVALVLAAALWVFCKRSRGNHGTRSKKRESLASLRSLLHHPCSPETKEALEVPGADSQPYAHLLSYSVVIDVKSTV